MIRVPLAILLLLGGCAIDRSGLASDDSGGGAQDAGARDAGSSSIDGGPIVEDAGVDAPLDDGGPPPDDAGLPDACRPSPETCNRVDDDCDGVVDEGVFGVCGMGVGECVPGDVLCVDGVLSCTGATGPRLEICNDRDDDCDAMTDEDNPEGGAPCGVSDVGACTLGTETCVGGAIQCVGDVGPVMETCNAVDDDCDGDVDEEGCPCDRRTSGASVYLFCDSTTSWTSARDACAARGYHLVTIEDSAENDFLRMESAGIRGDRHWWIGLNDRGTEGTFVWLSGSGSYRDWNGGEPDNWFGEDCVALWPGDGEWTDRDCDNSYRYICEIP